MNFHFFLFFSLHSSLLSFLSVSTFSFKLLLISVTCYQHRQGHLLDPSRSLLLTPAENWPHLAINSSCSSLSRDCDAHWKKGKKRGIVRMRKAPRRIAPRCAGYVYRYHARSPRRWPRGSFNGDYRRTWTRWAPWRRKTMI